jgi:RNA polymerase sigma-70 factor (ECF subfamily)
MLLEASSLGEVDEIGDVRRLTAFRRGDEAAFEELYRQHVSLVYGLALRLTYRKSDAEDLTQEVFCAAWEHRTGFQSPSHLVNWLRRVAVNRWLNRARRRREFELDAGPEASEPTEPEAPPTSAPTVRVDLERALASLSPRLRAVVVLFDLYGLGHQEIAEELGMTAGASKVQLHRARTRLKEILQ